MYNLHDENMYPTGEYQPYPMYQEEGEDVGRGSGTSKKVVDRCFYIVVVVGRRCTKQEPIVGDNPSASTSHYFHFCCILSIFLY